MIYSTTTQIRLIMLLIFNEITSLSYALPRSKDYRGTGEVVANKNIAAPEPSCEQLKAMWRFSKRQSRAAEITNEIPMYRDPFADNIWEPYYASSRSIGGQRIRNTPVIGRVVHKPPYLNTQEAAERHKAFEEVARLYGMPPKQNDPSTRRKITFRGPSLGFPPQQGSFQHLKELIKTERARELQQQRATEEAAARAAALKDLSTENQRNHGGLFDHYDYVSDEEDAITSSKPERTNTERGGIISFPDLLAPAVRPTYNLARFVPNYAYTRTAGRTRAYRPQLGDFYHDGYTGYLP